MLGIAKELPPFEEQYYLQGFEPHMTCEDRRWIRLASLYPETIDHVAFYRNGALEYIAYDEPFTLGFQTTWIQRGTAITPEDREWKAVVHLRDGRELEKIIEL